MEIKIKMGDIFALKEVYTKLLQSKFPISTMFKLAKVNEELEKNVPFYTENFSRIVSEYAEKDEEGAPITTTNGDIKIKEEFLAEARREIDELLNIEISLPVEKISAKELENTELSLSDFTIFKPLIEE